MVAKFAAGGQIPSTNQPSSFKFNLTLNRNKSQSHRMKFNMRNVSVDKQTDDILNNLNDEENEYGQDEDDRREQQPDEVAQPISIKQKRDGSTRPKFRLLKANDTIIEQTESQQQQTPSTGNR